MTPTTGTEKRDPSSPPARVGDSARRFSLEGFETSEWEALADWDVPTGWPPADATQTGAFFATGVQPLPEWLAELTVPPALARTPQPPLPRRRDVRRGTAEIPVVPVAPTEYAAPANGVAAEGLRRRESLPAGEQTGPADGERTGGDPERAALPRRRDVHRPDRSAARRASVLAYTGGQPPSTTPVRVSGLPVAAARIGVVSVLVAVGAAVVGGEQLDLIGNGRDLSSAEASVAMSLAPLPSDPRRLTIWDKQSDQAGLRSAAAKVADRQARVAEKRRLVKIAAEQRRKKVAAAKAKAERIRAELMRDAQDNPRGVARVLVADRGWSAQQFTCLDLLWKRESNWNYRAQNPSSGAYGIPQSLPGSKMGSVASDWRTNPVTQIKWGLNYIADRYGTPCGAWAHSENRGWY